MRHRFVRRFLSLGPMGAADIQTVKPGGGATAGQLPGSTTTIGAGFVGQNIAATIPVGSAVPLTTVTPANVINTLALTAGIWAVYWQIDFILAAATVTLLEGGVTQNSATLPSQTPSGPFYTGDALALDPTTWVTASVTTSLTGMPQLLITGAQTIYLVAQSTFSAGAVSAYGSIAALRVG